MFIAVSLLLLARLPGTPNTLLEREIEGKHHHQSHSKLETRLKNNPALVLNTCDSSKSAVQKFVVNASTTKPTIYLATPRGGQYYCIDINAFNPDVNALVYTWPCGQSSAGSNEFWTVTDSAIQSLMDPGHKCLGVSGTPTQGAIVTTLVCNSSDTAQQLQFNPTTGLIVHAASQLCVDAGTRVDYCSASDRKTWKFCDHTAAIDDRAADIVSRMSVADKIQALGTGTPYLSSIGLDAYDWWSEATHGISHVTYDDKTPYASNTALPITTACSFNRSLWHATGAQIGREARAFQNVGNAYSTYWAPVINIVRDPRWGRNIETPGEDPYLSGQYAVNFVKGFQFAPEDPYHLQASACCKHYVANELDGWNNTDRYHFDANVSARDLADSYMPSFQACVEQGQVSGLMCSYNAVNGIPSCANPWLLQTVARDQWQFDGYITSDCDADSDVYFSHHYTNTPEESVREVLRAGTDVDCGGFVSQYAQSALDKGVIVMEDIDRVLRRLFRVRIRLGFFDPAGPLASIGPDQVCTPAALELARDGVRQGTVLLKNLNNTLPLDASKLRQAAVIGPNSLLSKDIAYYYGGEPCMSKFFNTGDAITEYVEQTLVVKGLPSVSSDDTSGFAQAVAAAFGADAVILALGSDLSLESEGHDRDSIALSDGQLWLIGNITETAPGPIIAVVFSGGAMDVSPLLANPKIGAVLSVGQPSVQTKGFADVIFGAAVPAGRMIQTTYPADYVNQVSMFDFGMRPGPSEWPPFSNPGRTYRFYTGTPVLPFGFGLSYTTFEYAVSSAPTRPVSLAAVRQTLDAASAHGIMGTIPRDLFETAADLYVNVTNTGSRDADDVVLGFLVPPGAGQNGVPLQELFGFQRVFVPAGETVTVYLGCQRVSLTQVVDNGVRVAWPGQYKIRIGVAETAKHGMGFVEHEMLVV